MLTLGGIIICIMMDENDLKKVGLELMFLTEQKCSNPQGITAVELSRLLDLNIDIVKKSLKILYDKGIIKVKGLNPKYWSFDNYNFQRMDENDEIFMLLCSFDDVDFDRYFSY